MHMAEDSWRQNAGARQSGNKKRYISQINGEGLRWDTAKTRAVLNRNNVGWTRWPGPALPWLFYEALQRRTEAEMIQQNIQTQQAEHVLWSSPLSLTSKSCGATTKISPKTTFNSDKTFTAKFKYSCCTGTIMCTWWHWRNRKQCWKK